MVEQKNTVWHTDTLTRLKCNRGPPGSQLLPDLGYINI